MRNHIVKMKDSEACNAPTRANIAEANFKDSEDKRIPLDYEVSALRDKVY
jgi:hypothetical protein